jgi:hypothetical protein
MTEQEIQQSQAHLRDFVFEHKLINKHSNICFKADLVLTTAKRNLELSDTIFLVTFDDFGSRGALRIHTDLDPYKYPTTFDAKWQKIRRPEQYTLTISGVHPMPEIGAYKVEISNPIISDLDGNTGGN